MQLLTTEDIDRIVYLYEVEKKSSPKIAKEFGVTSPSILAHLKKREIKRRTISDSVRKYSVDETFFEKIDTEAKAYWLGFLYADGCNRDAGKQRYLSLGLAEKDLNHILLFKKHIKSQHPIYHTVTKETIILNRKIISTKQARIVIGSNKISNDLNLLGMTPRKTLTLLFPNQEQVPTRLIHHFIRGYFDGDGTIYYYQRNKRKQFQVKILGTFDFLDNISTTFLQEASVLSKPKIFQEKQGENIAKVWNLMLGGNINILKIYNYLYNQSTIFLPRKKKVFQMLINQGIMNIEKGEDFYRAKIWKFWNPKGELVVIKNLKEFCRKNPQYKSTGLQQVYSEKERQYKGWTKYKEGKQWVKVILQRAPHTGKNYDFEDLLSSNHLSKEN